MAGNLTWLDTDAILARLTGPHHLSPLSAEEEPCSLPHSARETLLTHSVAESSAIDGASRTIGSWAIARSVAAAPLQTLP